MHDNYLTIDYDALTVEAMRGLVRKLLYDISERGLPDKHHFYISYITNYKDVVISDALRKKYPDEMTIVIENSFWDLNVDKESFTLKLSFDGIKNKFVSPPP